MNKQTVILIPAYNPDDKFINFLTQLKENGFNKIIIVNDGSKKELNHYFEKARNKYGCDIVTHEVNKGYGKALKSGTERFIELYGNSKDINGFVHCDCDGQHSINDIIRFSKELETNNGSIIVGIRNFDHHNVPFKNKLGNKITSLVFKLLIGIDIEDTQCGLRAIPQKYASFASKIRGDGFEYTTNLLLQAHKDKIKIKQLPIETIYLNNNETSHFNPLRDSIRIYSSIFKFILSSLSSSLLDILMFTLFLKITDNIILSTYLARIISCTYTFFVNKEAVFKQGNKRSLIRFIILCVVLGTLSAFITHALDSYFNFNTTLLKMLVDICLFFISYYVQKEFVFHE